VDEKPEIDFEDPNKSDLVGEVSVKEPVEYKSGKQKIILVDCGTKNNIIRAFLGRNISVVRVPYDYDFTKIESLINNRTGKSVSLTGKLTAVREREKINIKEIFINMVYPQNNFFSL
jgi:carbamoylphosphate synthase small subunit